jgi:hypothetical protein
MISVDEQNQAHATSRAFMNQRSEIQRFKRHGRQPDSQYIKDACRNRGQVSKTRGKERGVEKMGGAKVNKERKSLGCDKKGGEWPCADSRE